MPGRRARAGRSCVSGSASRRRDESITRNGDHNDGGRARRCSVTVPAANRRTVAPPKGSMRAPTRSGSGARLSARSDRRAERSRHLLRLALAPSAPRRPGSRSRRPRSPGRCCGGARGRATASRPARRTTRRPRGRDDGGGRAQISRRGLDTHRRRVVRTAVRSVDGRPAPPPEAHLQGTSRDLNHDDEAGAELRLPPRAHSR